MFTSLQFSHSLPIHFTDLWLYWIQCHGLYRDLAALRYLSAGTAELTRLQGAYCRLQTIHFTFLVKLKIDIWQQSLCFMKWGQMFLLNDWILVIYINACKLVHIFYTRTYHDLWLNFYLFLKMHTYEHVCA